MNSPLIMFLRSGKGPARHFWFAGLLTVLSALPVNLAFAEPIVIQISRRGNN